MRVAILIHAALLIGILLPGCPAVRRYVPQDQSEEALEAATPRDDDLPPK